MRHFFVAQEGGDDAGYFAAGSQGGRSHFTHQADAATAVHQPAAAFGNGTPQLAGSLAVARVFAEVGAAIDDNIVHSVHIYSFR